jgi:phytoene synthase
MELYDSTSYELAKTLTQRYSTSFGKSTARLDTQVQPHIYAIYGLVRIADEIVDTYQGNDAGDQLDALEKEVYAAIRSGFSANPIVHAFATTAKKFDIGKSMIAPFFKSMRMDITDRTYTQNLYETYIYGSAEVIGLMCLKVFCGPDTQAYEKLTPGARALGSAYQKVNFLRDIAADHAERGRMYFPGVSFETFNERDKQKIVKDIKKEFHTAKKSIPQLPDAARGAVMLSYLWYEALLQQLERTPAEVLKTTRIRVPAVKKARLFMRAKLKGLA